MIKKIALALAVLIALAAGYVAMQPAEFVVERTTLIGAPADVVYPHIASLRAMDVWSPWVKMDPQLAVQYEGPESGVGARSSWEGPQMGKGSLTVTAVDPNREVEMRLEMLAPMQATNRIVFTLAPKPEGTEVTWHMDGVNGFIGKAMSLVMGMDAMVGEPFSQGLAALKVIAETDARKTASN